MKTFCDVYLCLMLFSIAVMFAVAPLCASGFCLLIVALMWVLDTGKRKAAKNSNTSNIQSSTYEAKKP